MKKSKTNQFKTAMSILGNIIVGKQSLINEYYNGIKELDKMLKKEPALSKKKQQFANILQGSSKRIMVKQGNKFVPATMGGRFNPEHATKRDIKDKLVAIKKLLSEVNTER